MKKIIGAIALLCSSMVFAGNNSYLFLQTSNHGTLVKNTDNTYTLSIAKPQKFVGYFTDRPERKAGLITLKKFLSLWTNTHIKDNFSKEPPNVAVALRLKQGGFETVFAEVTHPILKDHQLIYTLKIISKNKVMTGDLKHISLFFDDIIWNPGGWGAM